MFKNNVPCICIISVVWTLALYKCYENKEFAEYRQYELKEKRYAADIKDEKLLGPEQKYTQATFKYNCTRPNGAVSYTMCDELPYSTISCRKETKGNYGNEGHMVPNVVHYIWFGNRTMKYYHYLSVRSAAANQRPEKIIFHIDGAPPGGKLWERLVKEIPCLETKYLKCPDQIFGNEIKWILHKTDVARNDVLIKHGGIYVDSDVLILRSLDPIRHFSFTIGRSTPRSLSNGAFLSKPNAAFLQECIQAYRNFSAKKMKGKMEAYLSCKYPMKLWKTRYDLPVHVDLTKMQRPNPWSDGRDCISNDSFNISQNYMLHIHPIKSTIYNPKIFNDYTITELRTLDTTYGAAARAALFGFQDLVYLKHENVEKLNRKPPKQIKAFVDL